MFKLCFYLPWGFFRGVVASASGEGSAKDSEFLLGTEKCSFLLPCAMFYLIELIPNRTYKRQDSILKPLSFLQSLLVVWP